MTLLGPVSPARRAQSDPRSIGSSLAARRTSAESSLSLMRASKLRLRLRSTWRCVLSGSLSAVGTTADLPHSRTRCHGASGPGVDSGVALRRSGSRCRCHGAARRGRWERAPVQSPPRLRSRRRRAAAVADEPPDAERGGRRLVRMSDGGAPIGAQSDRARRSEEAARGSSRVSDPRSPGSTCARKELGANLHPKDRLRGSARPLLDHIPPCRSAKPEPAGDLLTAQASARHAALLSVADAPANPQDCGEPPWKRSLPAATKSPLRRAISTRVHARCSRRGTSRPCPRGSRHVGGRPAGCTTRRAT